jgi:probable HAF family extracellular repeat protein
VTDIQPAGFQDSWVADVNGRGVAILNATRLVGSELRLPHAFVWRRGKLTELPPLEGGNGALVRDINKRGEVAGFCQSPGNSGRPCLWRDGRPVALSLINKSGEGVALAINDDGVVVGEGQTFIPGQTHAFRWRQGVVTDLGDAHSSSSATGLNERGQVIGVWQTGSGGRGFLWENGRMTDLGTLSGGAGTVPADINEHGQIVGSTRAADGASHAFLWQRGRMTDLGPGGATAINDHGQVLGVDWSGGWFRRPGGVRTRIAGRAAGLNERGWVAGVTDAGRAFLLRGDRMTVGAPVSSVTGLNDYGLVGVRLNVGTELHAAVWK